jgi:hypothetical protein
MAAPRGSVGAADAVRNGPRPVALHQSERGMDRGLERGASRLVRAQSC